MIKTTLNSIVKAKTALAKLADKDLPVMQSYNIAKIIRQADNALLPFEDARIRLCEKYGTLDDSKKQYRINPADNSTFQQDMNELLSQTVEIEAEKIKVTENVTLSAKDIIDLEDFLLLEG